MDNYNNHMSCLSLSVINLGNKINIVTSKANSSIAIMVNRVNQSLTITCSLVCLVNRGAYLRVKPDYVWLTPDMLSNEFDIYSNVGWEID